MPAYLVSVEIGEVYAESAVDAMEQIENELDELGFEDYVVVDAERTDD